MRRALVTLIALVLVLFGASERAEAHGMRTATITVSVVAPDEVDVAVRAAVPEAGLEVALEGCVPTTERRFRCEGGWAGHRIGVRGLGVIVSEAIVALTVDGETTTHLVQPASPDWVLPATRPSSIAVAEEYVGLGVKHIATGADHLLFLLGLVLCLRRARAVLLAETAFTLSHSVTFSLSALGIVRVPAAWAEACIAFSLVLLALDVNARPANRREARRITLLAFVFGLVHGLGFAGGLREIGIPEKAVLPALVGFAGGVELGQVAFLLVALALVALATRLRRERFTVRAGAWAIGVLASFWLIERTVALLARGGSS
jgi:hypothetical protein